MVRADRIPTLSVRSRADEPHRRSQIRGVGALLVATIVTLFALETILTGAGLPTYYPADLPEFEIKVSPWWACDEAGCHFVYDAARQACETGELDGRACRVNRQGFPDADDFEMTGANDAEARILILGDSFAFGMHADSGKSFAETLEARLPASHIWNAAIPGSGTAQAIASFDAFAPILRPQLTILAFYTNDFDDNLLPMDSWLNAVSSDGMAINVRKYGMDKQENVSEFDLRAIRLLTVYGKAPPQNDFEYRLGLTRLGTLALQLLERLQAHSSAPERFDRRVEATRGYLRDLRERASVQGSALLTLLIPAPEDVNSAGRRHQLALRLLDELGIAYMDLREWLEREADYHPAPDFHWNNAGHQKIGAVLSSCIEAFAKSGDLANCLAVTIPAGAD